MKFSKPAVILLTLALVSGSIQRCSAPSTNENSKTTKSYDDLVTFFSEWRKFQAPVMIDGVPDYTMASMKKQQDELKSWQQRLNAFDTTGWPIKQQVDWYIVWAEMNGLDFDHRVLRPWENDPAFYVWFFSGQPDTPLREGPHISGAVELHTYKMPLSAEDAKDIATRLVKAPQVFEQAKKNLTGKSKDLWVLGARALDEAQQELGRFSLIIEKTYPDLLDEVDKAMEETEELADWVEAEIATKTGPSGVGVDNYNWYLKNVHLVPYTWQDEKVLLERELNRAHSGLRFAEHRNRKLPRLQKAAQPEDYSKRLNDGVTEYMKFLDQGEMLTVRPYMEPAMRAQVHGFVPNDSLRGFFDEVDYRDPMPMRSHHYHWIDKAREIEEPVESMIRQIPLVYNIWDTRAEGMATAMEELVMNGGLLVNRPRATELVYIMLAQRAARGLGGLYQHARMMDFDHATEYASKWVPWGLLPAKGGTIQHEEAFYLQQPAYGESYVTGKIMIDQLVAEYARQREGKFVMKEFLDDFNKRGIIPVSLIYWEMTGDKSMLK